MSQPTEELVLKGEVVALSATWTVGERLDGGGFGQVYKAKSETGEAVVAKFVPQAPGAGRELLFVDLGVTRNVVPIIDSGEFKDHWVLVMPRADTSLRRRLNESGCVLEIADTLGILMDILTALTDLEGKVIHRDIKPENILKLDGRWCLADFGISRYAEATTAPDTQKFAMSPPYTAPERWRAERATSAADVYAVGVMAFEMLAGGWPFRGVAREDFREAHLHQDPPHLNEVPAGLAALVDECLYKAPGARPSPANFHARLDRLSKTTTSSGAAALQEANRAEVRRRAEGGRSNEQARSKAEQRAQLADSAERSFARIAEALRSAVVEAAPSVVQASERGGWSLRLGSAELSLSAPRRIRTLSWGGWEAPAFDVIAVSQLGLRIPADSRGYEGRSHSLWFGDVQVEGQFGWFESAFIVTPSVPKRGRQDPFGLDPGEESAKAIWSGMAEFQAAWPFTHLVIGELEEFVDRWCGWLAAASEGQLGRPSMMPERPPIGSWRR